MILLTSTSDVLSLVTSAAASIDVYASWMDNNAGSVTPGRTNTATISTATTTTIVAAPGASVQRNIKTLTIRNRHASLACDVTLKHTDGTNNLELVKATLQPGDQLIYLGESFTQIPSPNNSFTLGSTLIPLGSTTTTIAGLTLSGATISGTTTLPGSGQLSSGGNLSIGTTAGTVHMTISRADELFQLENSNGAVPANQGRWRFSIDGGGLLVLQSRSDANVFGENTLAFSRSGTSVSLIQMLTANTLRLAINSSGLLCLAGTTASFPALKRSSTELQVRLADDSADAPLRASVINGTAAGSKLIDQIFDLHVASTAQLDATSNTTLAAVTGLSITLVAGKTYILDGWLSTTANASGGLKVALVASGGLTITSGRYGAVALNGATTVANTTVTALGSNIVANTAVITDVEIGGTIVVNAGGTLTVQAAQNASFGTASSVFVNSHLTARRIN